MLINSVESYQDDPLYRSAFRHFQSGEWGPGLTDLSQLEQAYPLESDLRAIRQEMQLRAQINVDERIDRRIELRRRILNLALRLVVVSGLVALVFLVIRSYAGVFAQQWNATRQEWQSVERRLELAAAFRDAQDLLQAGRAGEALEFFESIKEQAPDYPTLDSYLEQAKVLAALEQKYSEALRLINLGDTGAAMAIFAEIKQQDPLYRDVDLRMAEIKQQNQLEASLKQAESAYQAGQWETAIAGYESLRKENPQYQVNLVEEHLYDSFLGAAQAVLVTQPESLAAFQTAQGYLRKAKALRPGDPGASAAEASAISSLTERLAQSFIDQAQQALAGQIETTDPLGTAQEYLQMAMVWKPSDPGIQLQLQLAQLYIAAQDEFAKGQWDKVIADLETVYGEEMGYAVGTARQTLVEAYIARGDGEMDSGEYDSALSDYQRAAVLAGQDPAATLRLSEVKIRLANAQGKLEDYETAVKLYQEGVELGNLAQRAASENPDLADALADAEAAALAGNYRQAAMRYREALRRADETYDMVTHVVKSGEYLTLIAAKYNTRVQLIVEVNGIVNPNRIYVGQELLIPILPTP